jgi:hypothetical protein
MRDVITRRRAIQRAQTLDDVPHRGRALGDRAAGERGRQGLQIGLGHPVGLGQERRIARPSAAQRIDGSGQMPVSPNGLRQLDGADDGARVGKVVS